MPEDIEITTKKPTPTGPNHKESTPLSNINETIIREAKLNILTLGNDPSGTYNKFNKKLRYIITIINKIKLKISRTIIVKELILKIWGFECFDFINKQYFFYFLEYVRKII